MFSDVAFAGFFTCAPLSSTGFAVARGDNATVRRRGRDLRVPRCEVTSAHASAGRAEALRNGATAAVEDFVSSGMNVYLGGSDHTATAAVAEAIAARWEVGAILDVAFKPITKAAQAAARDFSLPTDFSVNNSSRADLFLAPATQIDCDLNVALGVDDALRSEKFASSIAKKSVFLIHEADFSATSNGISSFPVQLDSILPEAAMTVLKGRQLLSEIGVRDICLRGDCEDVADVFLRPGADVTSVNYELCSQPGIAAVGLVPSTERVTAVVVSEDQTYDITSSLANMASIASSNNLKRLERGEREVAMKRISQAWSLTQDGREAIEREFRFQNPEQTEAFMAHIFRTAKIANSYPEVNVTFNRVHLRLATLKARGVTQLDIAFACEMEHLCDVLHGCST